MHDCNVILHTSGTGYWTTRKDPVRVTGYELSYVNSEADFGELCVFFDTDTWMVEHDGLIYTDPGWMQELKSFLSAQGYDVRDVSYSEQGMQGEGHVSLDVGEHFISSYMVQHRLAG